MYELLGLVAALRCDEENGQMPAEEGATIGEGGLASRRDRERRAAIADDVEVLGMVDDMVECMPAGGWL